jgi:eukaryotic-like serine/threonine-protein kinase
VNQMTEAFDAPTDDDPRLVRAAQEYLAQLEASGRPERGAFLARFSDLAAQLGPYLDALDMVHGAGPLLPRSSAAPAVEALPPIEPLGDFHIVREIGRGGMGVVYEAVQLSLGRRVALKVLPFAAALDARQLQRFKNEAQAAAQLHHTNIVPVYAIGCERGTHYYAMQLIEGQDLADLIDQLRSAEKHAAPSRPGPAAKATRSDDKSNRVRPDLANPAPAPPLTGREAPKPLESPTASTVHAPAAELSTQHATRSTRFYRTAAKLTAQAADALEHAHQFDVIHRDVKPANLIVDERGNVWVTDFGLAQFQTGQGLTRTGDMMGTLRYMSPEQAAGNHALLDARTDVYSLGATLYELLTLQPLFDGADAQRLLQQILHDEPRRPRSLDRSIPAELETIVLKSVGKNPADRYTSAREFAEDLRRFLENRPILARPPSLVQRSRKWARRHPSIVVAAVVLCALTTVGSLVSAWMIRQEQDKTLQQFNQTKEGLRLARQSADEMIQISEQELADKPFAEAVRKRMLMSALVYYQGLIAQSSDDATAQDDLKATQEHVKKILADLAVLQGGGRVDLLHRDDVKDDLGLTADKRAQVEDLLQRLNRRRMEGFGAFQRLPAEERQQRSLDDARANEAAMDEILTTQQRARLDQIALQLQGLSAFHDSEVAATLQLTTEQKRQLRDIEAAAFLPGPGPGRGPGEPGKGQEAGFQSPTEKFLQVLTAEQARRWKNMTGEPFKETRRPPPPNGPGGPRGPEPHDRPGPGGPGRPPPRPPGQSSE